MQVTCSCGKVLNVPEKLAGKTARCPACKKILQMPGAAPAASAAFENHGRVFVREETGRSGRRGRQEGALSEVQQGTHRARPGEEAVRPPGVGAGAPVITPMPRRRRTRRPRPRRAKPAPAPTEDLTFDVEAPPPEPRQAGAGARGFAGRRCGEGRIRPRQPQVPELQGRPRRTALSFASSAARPWRPARKCRPPRRRGEKEVVRTSSSATLTPRLAEDHRTALLRLS